MVIHWTEPARLPIGPMIDRQSCWWCGGKGDSREHRIKRTDLIREGGKAIDPDRLFINRAQIQVQTRGLNASTMKFRLPLCKICNNQRSQPFDNAQVSFIEYYLANEERTVRSKRLRMESVFPTNLLNQAEDLRRYFVKHVACVIGEAGFSISHNVKSYLDGKNPLTDIAFLPHVCESMFDILAKYPPGTSGPIGYEDIVTSRSRKTGIVYEISGNWIYRSLHIRWAYRWMNTAPLPNPFVSELNLPVDAHPGIPTHFGPIPPRQK